jgi:hypothetical protein
MASGSRRENALRPRQSRQRLRISDSGHQETNCFGSVLVLGGLHRPAPFDGIAHIVNHKDRERRHALSLLLSKCFVEWLPRLRELIQIG